MPAQPKARLIAFYLPQYYPIPENDEWWGKGFTEWTNVAKAKPLFANHYQPRLPADLGFYDLRLPEVRQAQADLARQFGIYGFCYYHYWFEGKLLLDRPLNEVLDLGQPDFPFCLCWANHNWTRGWDGGESDILIEQKYSEEDHRQHIQWLVRVFQDRRYIRVEGKPLFLIYRASQLHDSLNATSIWRDEARRAGIGEIYLCRVDSFADERGDPAKLGFDAAVEFQPDSVHLDKPLRRGRLWRMARRLGLATRSYEDNWIFEYSSIVQTMLQRPDPPYKRFPCITPSWDNTPRRKSSAVVLKNSTPELYGKWLRAVIEKLPKNEPEENIIFINAWNEWGEGNALEPCQRWGRAYLEATKRAVF